MSPVNILISACAFLPFAAFAWALKGHFRSGKAMPLEMRLISAFSVASFLWLCARLVKAPASQAWPVAILLFALSLGLFLWAITTTRPHPPALAFVHEQPDALFRNGPYHYVRHPFYLAYLIFWVATALATPAVLPWAVPVFMVFIYASTARDEERTFEHSPLAAAYTAYRAEVGMFLPWRGFRTLS